MSDKMTLPDKPCSGCAFHSRSELDWPCVNCVHSHVLLGGCYLDYFSHAEGQSDDADPHKDDDGKARISLVPTGIIWAIAEVREYGLKKYLDTGREGWRSIEEMRIYDAMLRHILRDAADPGGIDGESGLPHLWHAACNMAFLIERRGPHEDDQPF